MRNHKNIICISIIFFSLLAGNAMSKAVSKINKPQSAIGKLKINEKITITVNSFTHTVLLLKRILVIQRTKQGFIATYNDGTISSTKLMDAYLLNKFKEFEKQLNFTEDITKAFSCTKTSEYLFASRYKNFKSRDTQCKFEAFEELIQSLYTKKI